MELAEYPTWVNPSGRQHLLHLIGDQKLFNELIDSKDTHFEPSVQLTCDMWEEEVSAFLLYK